MITCHFLPAAAVLLAAVPMVADAAVTVERAVVPLTHEAVARAYDPTIGDFPVVGNPGAPENDRWADLFFRYHFMVKNEGVKPATVRAEAAKPADFDIATEFRLEPEKAEVAPGQTAGVTLVMKVPGEAAAKLPKGYTREIAVRFSGEGVAGGEQKVVFWVPAVAKILAGSDGKGIPADVCPEGADYAEEFSGGWDGTGFKSPFAVATEGQIASWRKTVAQGLKPDKQDQVWHHGNGGMMKSLAETDPGSIADWQRDHTKHAPTAEAIQNLALSWAYTGDEADAGKAARLILAVVDRAERLGFGQDGRVGQNGLSDAWFTSPVFRAIDLLAGAGKFSAEELTRIRRWMTYQANIMRDQIFAYSNMQTEECYPIMIAGLHAKDFKLARFSYYPPYGMEGQLSGAFYADGFHREHQNGYHFQTIIPITDQAEALLRLGFCGYDERVHRALMNPVGSSGNFVARFGGFRTGDGLDWGDGNTSHPLRPTAGDRRLLAG